MKTVDAKHPIEFTVPASGVGSFYVQEDHRSNFYNHYHRHKEYQISYILKGRGSVVIGNLIQPFFENEIYILKANDPHIFIKEGAEEEQIHAIHIFVALISYGPSSIFLSYNPRAISLRTLIPVRK